MIGEPLVGVGLAGVPFAGLGGAGFCFAGVFCVAGGLDEALLAGIRLEAGSLVVDFVAALVFAAVVLLLGLLDVGAGFVDAGFGVALLAAPVLVAGFFLPLGAGIRGVSSKESWVAFCFVTGVEEFFFAGVVFSAAFEPAGLAAAGLVGPAVLV